MITAFVRFYFSRTLANWRTLRRECMRALPKQVKRDDAENEQ